MPIFTTRVELHGLAGPEVYLRVHDEMFKAGFQRFIIADDGRAYEMLPGEYSSGTTVDVPAEHIRDLASATVGRVWKSFSVFVTKGDQRAWANLNQINSGT